MLKARSPETWKHSIRVGVLTGRIGDHLSYKGIKGKPLFWAGLLHDPGKILVDPDLLTKKERFTARDRRMMEPHGEYGFRMLRGIHDWTAHIMVRHHRFGKHPYPKEIPPASNGRSEMFDVYGRLLALADYYDALMHRDNEKFGKGKLSAKEKRAIYLRENRDQRKLILELEGAGILTFS